MSRTHDKFYLRRAREMARFSPDPSSKMGAVLVLNPGMGAESYVLGSGCNRFPPGIANDARWHDRAEKYELVIHAEMSALLQAFKSGHDPRDATLYFFGYESPPCRNCTKHLIESGVTRIVGAGIETPERWVEDLKKARATLDEAGVVFETIPESEL